MSDVTVVRPRSRRRRSLLLAGAILASSAVQVGVLPTAAHAVTDPGFTYVLSGSPAAPGPLSVGSEVTITGTATNTVPTSSGAGPATLSITAPTGVTILEADASGTGVVGGTGLTRTATFADGVTDFLPETLTIVASIDSPAALFDGAGNDLVFNGALTLTGVSGSPVNAAPIGFDINEPGAITSYPGCRDSIVPRNDDGSSALVDLPFGFNFFGTTYDSVYVNNNGNITFEGPQSTYIPYAIGATPPMIAAFFADIDTRNTATNEVSYGAVRVNPESVNPDAFCVNWVNVGEYSNGSVPNSFQLLLINRGGGDVDIVFNYDRISWDHGGAGIGYTAGTGDPDTYYELPGSRVSGAFLDSSPTSLISSSQDSLQLGRYIYRLRGGLAPVGGRVSGFIYDPANNPLAGSPVQVCPSEGPCVLTQTGSTGRYSASGLAAGTYSVYANPPAGATNMLGTFGEPFTVTDAFEAFSRNVTLGGTLAPPESVDFEATRGTGAGGVPRVYYTDTPPLGYDGCAGGTATYNYYRSGVALGDPVPMTEGPAGHYSVSAMRSFGTTGNIEIRIAVDCPGEIDEDVRFPIYIDPSGFVRTVTGTPIVGATVTLYRSDNLEGPFTVVPDESAIMSPSNRTNPDVTDATGHFGWDVIAGFYKVRASATVGETVCTDPANSALTFVETAVMIIPPPVTDLDIRLACGTPVVVPGGGGSVPHPVGSLTSSPAPSPTSAAPAPSPTASAPTAASPTTTPAPSPTVAPAPATGAPGISLSVDVPEITAGNRPTLSGVARGADGAPLANTLLHVFRNTGSGWGAETATPTVVTDSLGRFALRVAPQARTAYGVNLDDTLRSNVVVVVVHLRIDLNPITGPIGRRGPIGGRTTPLLPGRLVGLTEGLGASRRFLGSATVNSDGTFSVPSTVDLAPGVHILSVYISPTSGLLRGARSITVTVA